MAGLSFSAWTARATLFDRASLLPRPVRIRPDATSSPLVLVERAATVDTHPQLPPTPVWAYSGQVPGPVLEVAAGSSVSVLVRNEIEGSAPFAHVVVETSAGGSMNEPGSFPASRARSDLAEAQGVAELDAWTVLHLHGAPTDPDSDGWTDNVLARGQQRLREYEFPREYWPLQPSHAGEVRVLRSGAAPQFWYHDHAMGATRFTVFAGLAGMVLVRDPLEEALGLPTDPEQEIPLLLMDRNYATVDGTTGGALSGAFLHKVETDVRECFAPVNLVNGLAWPRCEVSPRVHRLRIVCGANARTYRLHFVVAEGDRQEPIPPEAIQQIGTDGGLLGHAVDLPSNSVTLAPGERADVLVDFGLLATRGLTQVVVANSAPAPFGGDPASEVAHPVRADPAAYLTVPEVMRFDIVAGEPRSGVTSASGIITPIRGMPLDPEFARVGTSEADLPAGHGESIIALREEGGMLYLHELIEESVADARGMNLFATRSGGRRHGIRVTLPDRPGRAYVTAAKRFTDSVVTMIRLGDWHAFRVINLSPDTHPFHVHLTQLQAVQRRLLMPLSKSGIDNEASDFAFAEIESALDDGLDANERGWKDTIRVNPGRRGSDDRILSAEQVLFAGCFARHAGRYMFHCHILEHEDADMMRPMTVMPASLMRLMAHRHLGADPESGGDT